LYKSLTEVLNYPKDKVRVIINHRFNGNGYNPTLVSRITKLHEEEPIDTIWSADHGSADELAYQQLKKIGINKLVITDHHTIKYDNYPSTADVFVNNQRKDSTYYRTVSGCFVAYLTALSAYHKLHGVWDHKVFNSVLPYVAITTISDVMDLDVPINRQVVHAGLNEMNSFRNKVWIVLKNMLGIGTTITAKNIGFKLAPLINTGSRVGSEELPYDILASNTVDEAQFSIKQLLALSMDRKRVQKVLFKEADILYKQNPYPNSIVVKFKSKYAVNGIVAAQVGNKYNKPTVCFIESEDSDILTGSCRGILPELDVTSVFQRVHEEDPTVLIKFGGHTMAAGCSLTKDKFEEFQRLFDKHTALALTDVVVSDKLIVDKIISSNNITPHLAKELEVLAPYGKNWPEVVYMSTFTLNYILVMGTIVKLSLITSDGTEIKGMSFFSNSYDDYTVYNIKDRIKKGSKLEIAYSIELNSFNSNTELLLNIIKIKNLKE